MAFGIAWGWLRATVAAAASLGPEARRITLDQLRADLSHEMAAKLARLAGLIKEWRLARFREDDLRDVLAVWDDVWRIHVRHARTASGGPGTFLELARTLARASSLRGAMGRTARRGSATPGELDRAERDLLRFSASSRRLIEALSARYGARFGELVTDAAEEIRRENANLGAASVPVVIDSADGGATTWIPRTDVPRWSDLLRNLIRNAAQATRDRSPVGAGHAAGGGDDDPPPVVVKLRPAPGRGGACVEIIDEGVGMTEAQIGDMWGNGFTSHGEGHGQGLTAEKLAFIRERAELEIRSVPHVGTCVRLEMPPRDVVIRPPRRWSSPPLFIPAAAVLSASLGLGLNLWQPELVATRVVDNHVLVGYGHRGRVIWNYDAGADILANCRSGVHSDSVFAEVRVPPLLLHSTPEDPLAIATTRSSQGPGSIFAISRTGSERWVQTLAWTRPDRVHTGRLMSVFQAESVWNPSGQKVIVLNVRDDNWGATSTQFLTANGIRVGEYLHPGHLEFVDSGDFDGDGRIEIAMTGNNNDAAYRPPYQSDAVPADAYVQCLIMLESPMVDGQAFPYGRWSGVRGAREEAYLLVPPLRPADYADPRSTTIQRINFGAANKTGDEIEIFLRDGRIYLLDRKFRPIRCNVGDHTPAAEMAPTRPYAPLLYFHDGRADTIDLEVKRGI